MKDKTAMQELIEQAKTGKEFSKYGFVTWEEVIDAATDLLAKERQQIIDAVKYGFNDAQRKNPDLTFEQYYTTTFTQ